MRLTLSPRAGHEAGSIPLALLASIIVAGLITVLVASVSQNERTVRADRSYMGVIQTADAGVQDAYHQLNRQLLTMEIGDTAGPFTTELNGDEAEWEAERQSERRYEVTSQGTAADGTSRTVVATIEAASLFFPGAFGDRLVAMNGTSTLIDSYESTSVTCPPGDPDTCWGTDADFGTRKAALGTNNDFDFSGNIKVLRAILYDWKDNPATGVTAANPGGSRCTGNPCTPEVLGFEDEKLDYGSDEEMQFIVDKLEACGGTNADGQPRERGNWVFQGDKNNDPPLQLRPFSTAAADNEGSPADPSWNNYYCADSLQVLHDVELIGATPETPVVIFVRDSYRQSGHDYMNCPNCPNNMNQNWRNVRPKAASLQVYVKTEAADQGANVMIDQHAVFAGVMYAPRASCGSSGNAGVHMYGALICRNVDNVGNWRFHYDEALGNFSRAEFTISSWREE